MLIQFTVKNFKTFRETAGLSMVANNYDKTSFDENVHSCESHNLKLLRSAVIFGANASGKSKLMEAFQFLKFFVMNSSRNTQKGEPIPVSPFLFDEESAKAPTEFEIIFIHSNEVYRYGCELDSRSVLAEWLFHKPKTKEVEIFYREKQHFEVHEKQFPVGNLLSKDQMVRENALMLSVAAQFNSPIANQVMDWFHGFRVISALDSSGYSGFSLKNLEDESFKAKMLEMMSRADINIQDMALRSYAPDDAAGSGIQGENDAEIRTLLRNRKITLAAVDTYHHVYNSQKKVVRTERLNLETDESSGTNQFFALSGPIIEVLEKGWVLVVDELDSKMHPNLVKRIVELFNNKESNRSNAQLIFNSHNTNLLSEDLFRRDQIWFVEKDRYGAASLYSLSDYKARKEEQFEKNYLRGKYGAVPMVNEPLISYGSAD